MPCKPYVYWLASVQFEWLGFNAEYVKSCYSTTADAKKS